MIVCHRHRFVYRGPPKTGTTTLHRWFSQPAFCDERWTPINQDQHRMAAPVGTYGYLTVASIRHPLDREVSLWAHTQSEASRKQGLPEMGFSEFVREWQPGAMPFYRFGQAEWLDGSVPDYAVRTDRMARDLERLPFVISARAAGMKLEPLLRANRTRHLPWTAYYPLDGELVGIVSDRFRDDFLLYECVDA